MTDAATDPLPPLPRAQKHARLEVDTFCESCGYNLHSQAVERDERLGIFVCRCPECGRYHPAGVGMTATRAWANRLATAMLVVWILIVLFAIVWIIAGFSAASAAHVAQFSYHRDETLDGRRLEWTQLPGGWQPVLPGTTQPVLQYRGVRVLEPQGKNDYIPHFSDALAYLLGAAAIAFVAGMLMVIFFWHWKRKRYALAMLLPVAVGVFVAVVYNYDDEYVRIRPWMMQIVFGYAGLEMVFMELGVLLGRPIARGLLRMFIPPRPRQLFAFLWGIDGKPMPPATMPTT